MLDSQGRAQRYFCMLWFSTIYLVVTFDFAYLNSAATLLLEQNILRLHVTMDDFVSVEQVQALEQRMGEFSHQLQAESLELVLLDQLVEIDAEELECDAGVTAKDKVVKHVDNVEGVVFVLFSQVLQDADLLLRLAMEPFLIADHLERHVQVAFVIIGLHHLAKAPLPDDFQNFIAVSQMVVGYVSVGTLVVVIAAIVGTSNQAWSLLGIGANEIDLGVVKDLVVLVGGELVHVEFHHLQKK